MDKQIQTEYDHELATVAGDGVVFQVKRPPPRTEEITTHWGGPKYKCHGVKLIGACPDLPLPPPRFIKIGLTPLHVDNVGLVYLSPSYPARPHEARIWKRENVGALLESGFFVNDTDHFVEKALYDRGGEGAQE